MFRITDSIQVDAPIDRCFLLSTSIELVQKTIALHPVGGKTTGLIVNGDQLLWRGWKFGLPALHETLITGYTRPTFFQDTMGRGRFSHFHHDHHFSEVNGQTLMSDEVHFSLPFGPAGNLVGKYILTPHIRHLMLRRFALIKSIAEGPDWQRYIPTADSISTQKR